MKTLLFALALMSFSPSTQAAFEEKYIAALEQGGKFKCKDTPQHDGSFCISADKSAYITIPRGMTKLDSLVIYAHGLLGVCSAVSGEAHLRNESPTLLRLNAIGVMPFRPRANDESFPMSAFVKKIEKALGSDPGVEIIMAGHSAAGSFLGAELSTSPVLTKRVNQALLIDAIYGQDRVISLWQKVLSINPEMKIKVVSSSTAARSRVFVKAINKRYPGAATLVIKGERHCAMPKYFNLLE